MRCRYVFTGRSEDGLLSKFKCETCGHETETRWSVEVLVRTCRLQTNLLAASGHAINSPGADTARKTEMARRRHRNPPQPAPSGAVITRDNTFAAVRDFQHGATGFLVVSGPSLRTVDLGFLSERGILSLSVNNAGAYAKTTFWTHADPARKFHHGIWLDPSVIKFSPSGRVGKPIAMSSEPSEWTEPSGPLAIRCPSTYAILRNSNFNPDTWLTEETINWGNCKKSAAVNNHPRTLSVFLQALKLAYYIGWRRVFLLGCDFYMAPEQAYAFQQFRTPGACRSNNHAYVVIAWMLDQLKPRFDEVGFEVFNCNPKSNLKTFPTASLADALGDRSTFNGVPKILDTEGYYERPDKPE